jgi:acetoin utilization protein AcuB
MERIRDLYDEGGVIMLAKNWMSKKVITVDANASMQDAIETLKENNIRFLPVMKKRKLVGVLTDQDLKRASASDATTLEIHELLYLLSKIKVKDIMSKDVIVVPFDYTVEETAEILLKHKISGAPVLNAEDDVIGVITQDDVFRALISLTGVAKRGIQFSFRIEDRPGSIKELTDIIRNYGGRLVSILSSYDEAPTGFRDIYVRACRISSDDLAALTLELEEKGSMLYMVDHEGCKREVRQ